MKGLLIFSNFLILLIVISMGINCKDTFKFLYKFSSSFFSFKRLVAESASDKIILLGEEIVKTYILEYSKLTNEMESYLIGENKIKFAKRRYYDSSHYIELIDSSLYFYNRDNKKSFTIIYISSGYGSLQADFVITKDKKLIFFGTYGGSHHICKYNYLSFENGLCNINYSSSLGFISNFHVFYISDKIIVFYLDNTTVKAIIFTSDLKGYSTYNIYNSSYYLDLYMVHSDKNQDAIIICNNFANYKDYSCVALRIENEELKIGNFLNVFSSCDGFNIALIEDNKIGVVCTESELYFSTIIYDNGSLKFGEFKNKKLFTSNKYLPSLFVNQNYGLILYILGKSSGEIYEQNLFRYCQPFTIDNITPNSKILINFKNYTGDGIDGKIDELYIYTNNTKISIYKDGNRKYSYLRFKLDDKIYISTEDSEKPLILFYGFNNKKCQINLETKKTYIKVSNKVYRCFLNPIIKEINNIISVDLEEKIFNIFGSKKFEFTVKFEKKITNKDIKFNFLNQILNCKINDNQVICTGILPAFISKLFTKINYVYSKLSCTNKIPIGPVKIKDDYILGIYEAKNISNITYKINKNYNPEEKIKNFSVDMISYYLWFSSFGYCDDEVISKGECCKNEILDDSWEIIEHKNYKKKIENDDPINEYLKDIDEFKMETNNSSYYYNFAILKSNKYKKYIFCFPGTTSIMQFISEIIHNKKTQFLDYKNINVMEYFYEVFFIIYKGVFSNKIVSDLKSNSDYQIIFTGHSLGGAIATLISYYYAKKKLSSNEPVLITFGQPRVGDINFSKDYMNLISLVFRVAREEDLFTWVPLKNKKDFPLLNKLAYKSSHFIFDFITLYKLRKELYDNILKMIPDGYSHIGGLYLLKNDTFYHCKDFFNDDTKHPICRNIPLKLDDYHDILNNHGYLKYGENNLAKCQKNKNLTIISF